MTRPDPAERWPNVPDGFAIVAVVAEDWRVLDPRWLCEQKKCRRSKCPHRGVAELARPRHYRFSRPPRVETRWWAYCAEHLYGCWIEDSQVMRWVLRPIEEVARG